MSGREPSTWILREPGIGRVTDSDSCSVCCSSEEGTAFMAFVLGMSRTKRRRRDLHGRLRQGAEPRGSHPSRQSCEASLRRHHPDQVRRVCLNRPLPVPPLQAAFDHAAPPRARRSEEHTSELQSPMRTSYAVFCLKKTNNQH